MKGKPKKKEMEGEEEVEGKKAEVEVENIENNKIPMKRQSDELAYKLEDRGIGGASSLSSFMDLRRIGEGQPRKYSSPLMSFIGRNQEFSNHNQTNKKNNNFSLENLENLGRKSRNDKLKKPLNNRGSLSKRKIKMRSAQSLIQRRMKRMGKGPRVTNINEGGDFLLKIEPKIVGRKSPKNEVFCSKKDSSTPFREGDDVMDDLHGPELHQTPSRT